MKIETFSEALDELRTDLLVSTLFENERPPMGVTGLIDWRLNGFLSNRILDRTIRGEFDERVLIPLHGRLPARRWLLIGLGKREEFTLTRALSFGSKLAVTLARIGAADAAISVPKAVDCRRVEDTERTIAEAIRQSDAPNRLLIRWVDPAVAKPLQLHSLRLPGAQIQHHAA